MTARVSLNFPDLPDAACSAMTSSLFYLEHSGGDDYTEAKQLCALCPERVPCLQWALDNNDEFGCWGGASPLDRSRMMKARPAA